MAATKTMPWYHHVISLGLVAAYGALMLLVMGWVGDAVPGVVMAGVALALAFAVSGVDRLAKKFIP